MLLLLALGTAGLAPALPEDALAPALLYDGPAAELPRSRAATAQSAAPERLALFVDCGSGSDLASGKSPAAPLRTLAKAQLLVRGRGSPTTTGAVVTVRGTCELAAPLVFGAADSGASAAAPVVWQGADGALISGGASPAEWAPVVWPGAPARAVFAADVNGWPVEIKTLRTAAGDWAGRARWPKKHGDNSPPGANVILARSCVPH
jgi:hypothetical protein